LLTVWRVCKVCRPSTHRADLNKAGAGRRIVGGTAAG
jgi:hypothetical protein